MTWLVEKSAPLSQLDGLYPNYNQVLNLHINPEQYTKYQNNLSLAFFFFFFWKSWYQDCTVLYRKNTKVEKVA